MTEDEMVGCSTVAWVGSPAPHSGKCVLYSMALFTQGCRCQSRNERSYCIPCIQGIRPLRFLHFIIAMVPLPSLCIICVLHDLASLSTDLSLDDTTSVSLFGHPFSLLRGLGCYMANWWGPIAYKQGIHLLKAVVPPELLF